MHVIRWQLYFRNMIQHNFCVRGGAVGLGYKEESHAFIPKEFFIDLILPAALCPGGWTQPLTEFSTRGISGG
jgi:hypothetical protein